MRKSILLLFSLFAFTYIHATSIEVKDTIKVNTVWSGIDTVKITGDLLINNEITLTIDPGTVVETQGLYDIIVLGTIKAIGAMNDTIVFTAKNKTEGWGHFDYSSTLETNDSSVFQHCIFEFGKPDNKPSGNKDGGAFYISNFSNIEINHCVFRENGGLNAVVFGTYVEINFFSNSFINNTAYCLLLSYTGVGNRVYNNAFYTNTGGAAIYSGVNDQTLYSNNLMVDNYRGYYLYGSKATLHNNTIVGSTNTGILFTSNSDLSIYNTIIWGNQTEVQLFDIDSDPNFYNCDIEEGSDALTGAGSGAEFSGDYLNCISEDPLFTDTLAGDYSLPYDSPCKDLGMQVTNLTETDIAGTPRMCDDVIDLGAYEYYVAVDTVCDEVWGATNDTVHITGNIFVPDACTLTVLPGTTVLFEGLYKITVCGQMTAIGASDTDSIIFTAENKTEGWRGIKYVGNTSADKSVFKYCVFEYGKPINHNARSQQDGAAFQVTSFNNLEIENCSFRECESINSIVSVQLSKISVKNSKFQNNSKHAILLTNNFQNRSIIQNNIFINNDIGIYSGYSDSSYIQNNLLIGNTTGFYGYQSGAQLSNNTIVKSTNSGMTLSGNSDIEIYNTILYGNNKEVILNTDDDDPNFYNCDIKGGPASIDVFVGTYTGVLTNCLDTLPEFIDTVNFEFRLSLVSPLINKGTSDTLGLHLPDYDLGGLARIFNDTIDIGAYETENQRPTVVITPEASLTYNESIQVSIVFSEEVSGFELSDIAISNGSSDILGTVVPKLEYVITVTATNFGEVTINIPDDIAADIYGNGNVGSTAQYTYSNSVGLNDNPDIKFKLYPNPVKSSLFIETEGEIYVVIFDITGNTLIEKPLVSSGSIDFSEMNTGIYFVRIEAESGTKNFKIVKE